MYITLDGFAQVAASVTELQKLTEVLREDPTTISHRMQEERTEFWMRAFIRAFFAMAEGTIFGMKQTILTAAGALGINLSVAELALLLEKGYEMKENGDVKANSKFIRFESNFRFTVKTYAKVFEYDYTLDVQGQGWQAFRRSIEIRHRLTHPKSLYDLSLSIADVEDLDEGCIWFMESTGTLIHGAAVELSSKAEEVLGNKSDASPGV
jgi:hypothetical protein